MNNNCNGHSYGMNITVEINFDPGPMNQAQELIFYRKVQMINHPHLLYDQRAIPQTSLQKHLGMFLNRKLNFSEHLKTIFQ